jgi:hypothetical protein
MKAEVVSLRLKLLNYWLLITAINIICLESI